MAWLKARWRRTHANSLPDGRAGPLPLPPQLFPTVCGEASGSLEHQPSPFRGTVLCSRRTSGAGRLRGGSTGISLARASSLGLAKKKKVHTKAQKHRSKQRCGMSTRACCAAMAILTGEGSKKSFGKVQKQFQPHISIGSRADLVWRGVHTSSCGRGQAALC